MPSYLHRDHLGSVRAISDATGAKIESAVYKPFGEQTETLSPANLTPESKGWIGQRYDADAGLQYLNARYYDPVLGIFLQPDWFEVLRLGVGTNRFSYSFNDPVNFSDPSGHARVGSSVPDSQKDKVLDRADAARSRAQQTAQGLRELAGRDRPIGFWQGTFFGNARTRELYQIQQRVGSQFPGGDFRALANTYDAIATAIGPRGQGAIIHNDSAIVANINANGGTTRGLPQDQRDRVRLFEGGVSDFLRKKGVPYNPTSATGNLGGSANYPNGWFGLQGWAFDQMETNGQQFEYMITHEATHLANDDINDVGGYHTSGTYRGLALPGRLLNADAYACGAYEC